MTGSGPTRHQHVRYVLQGKNDCLRSAAQVIERLWSSAPGLVLDGEGLGASQSTATRLYSLCRRAGKTACTALPCYPRLEAAVYVSAAGVKSSSFGAQLSGWAFFPQGMLPR